MSSVAVTCCAVALLLVVAHSLDAAPSDDNTELQTQVSKAANSEIVTVELMKSFASFFMSLSATNIRVLDNCINRALYKIFTRHSCTGRYC